VPELKHLTRVKPVEAVIDLGEGDSINVSFDLNKITPHWMRAAEQRDSEQDTLSLSKTLAEVIISWDVTDDGKPFPAEPENIACLSYIAQSELLRKIVEASVPSDAEGEASSAPSPEPSTTSSEPVLTPQNGPVTSESPVPSASQSPT
jgi:hypothetical protein